MTTDSVNLDVAETSDVVSYLETVTYAHRLWHTSADAPPWQRPIEALILEIGQSWYPQALPSGVKRGTPKQCSRNARLLASRRTKTLRYCEGFALGPDSPLPVPHAWTVNASDGVVDPTWDAPERSAYYGVVIPIPVLRTMIEIAGQEGYFGSEYMANFVTLKLGRIPTVAELRGAGAARRSLRAILEP